MLHMHEAIFRALMDTQGTCVVGGYGVRQEALLEMELIFQQYTLIKDYDVNRRIW